MSQELPSGAKLHATLGRGLDWVWPSGAAWAYGDALRRAPGSAELHFLRGRALERARRWDAAAGAYGKAAAIEPTSVEFQGALVAALHHARKGPALVDALRRLAQLRPGQGEIHLLIGSLLRREGRQAEALRAFRLGVKLTPGPAARRFMLGEVLLGRDAWEETVDAWHEARRLEGDPESSVAPGKSALNAHPGRFAELHPRRPTASRMRGLLEGAGRPWSSLRVSCRRLVDRGARAITLEQRVRALRRAWQKTRPRPSRRRASGRPA
jgi:tetratricopeptide (TPR) repeat protein